MNNSHRPFLAALLGVLALGTPFYSTAAELGFYVGGQYGKTGKDENSSALDALTLELYENIDYAPAVRSPQFESDDATWGFFGGYRMLQNLAFEAGYLSLSDDVLRDYSTGIFIGNGSVETWSTSMGVRSKGFALSVLGVLPITYNWELFARGGVYLGSNTLSLYAVNQEGVGGADQITESSADFLAGVGAAYTLAEVYQLRAEYQRVFDAGAEEYGESDIDLITIGITVMF
jgi:OmpA-like transmembrane domain